ncbi:MAG: PH domain-containing protein [Candidatus Doudnabacteria bacterium]|nr:PH domain-containing protein [Candidatus Doudnabacteria bacterium]
MIKTEIKDNILHLYVEGADKIWAFKSQLSIPLKHITGIRLDEEIVNKWWRGLKLPGVNIPYVITAGTFYHDGKRIFWDIHHPKQAIILSLADEKYSELVIEVENPEMFMQEIQQAIK